MAGGVGAGVGELAGRGENFATYCRGGGGGEDFFLAYFLGGTFFLHIIFANFFLQK